MRRLLIRLLAGALTLVWLAPVPAQQKPPPLYRVELLVFRVTTPPLGEDWSAPPGYRGFGGDPAATPPVLSADDAPAVVKIYGPDRYQLGSTAARLRASGAYQPIAHAAWLQTATPWGRHVGIDLAELGIRSSELSGRVYLERGTLLHLGLDLRLGAAPMYHLGELRRVKYNEKHYYDHPAFGAIAIVSPVTGAEASAGS
ncbi:MAG: hypothetical protein IT480_09050 [Gammaproteobacteria bacterium]|nr:hypothetical protein [Gammaproteobacteria bacterium]